MSETKVPEIDEVSKAHCDTLRSGDAGDWGHRIAAHIESLALENARLKAELATDAMFQAVVTERDRFATEIARRYTESLRLLRALKQERGRAVKMLNDANRRLTALLDSTEERETK